MAYELILINNTQGRFKSAAAALNYGGNKAKGKYLMFIHQDFELDSPKWLEKAERILDNIENMGIVGVAGKYDRNLISNIKTGYPPIVPGSSITEPIKVQTLDECLIIIPRKVFREIDFDAIVCDNWHLYATDYCLTVVEAGYEVMVIPLGGYHVSPGYSFSPDEYYSTLKKLVKKHKSNYKWIYTSTGSWSTKIPISLQILYQRVYYFLLKYRWLVKLKKKIF